MAFNNEEPSDDATAAGGADYGDFSDDDAYDASIDADSEPATRGSDGQQVFLTDMADTLHRAGLAVNEQPGWQERCWPKLGGFSGGPKGIVIHHTGAGPNSDGQGDVDYIMQHAQYAPLANLYLDRQAQWWVIAAGGTNTNGRGGPWGDNLPSDTANSRCIGIQAGNSGTETWSTAVQDSYVKGVAALADHYGIDTGDVLSHHEWCKGHEGRGKWDPGGPSRFGSINQEGTWDMDKFRAEVDQARTTARTESPTKPNGPSLIVATSHTNKTHTIGKGETLSAISRRFGVSTASLIAANPHISDPDSIRAGQTLTLPQDASVAVERSPIPVNQVRYSKFDGSGSIDEWIEQACAAIGAPFNDHWRLGYNTLCTRESRFDPNAVNTEDSNAQGEVVADGHPRNCSRGIAQCIPTTFAENHAPGTSDSIYDPVANIAASMNYVRRRREYLVTLDGSNLKQQVQQADPDREPKGY